MIRKFNSRVNIVKVHYMCTCKCHNETPYFVQIIYTNKKKAILIASVTKGSLLRNTQALRPERLNSMALSISKSVSSWKNGRNRVVP
jgi:hypothetical protein